MSILLKVTKKHYLFLLLIPIVILGQYFVLMPHLQYGLIDLDDGSIYGFKKYLLSSKSIVSFLTESYQEFGVYAHQYYYLGVLNYFFGDNIVAYHWVTHIFKMLASIAAYPLFYVISGSTLIAFLAAIIFSFSHSSVGSLEAVVTGSDYPAMFALIVFLWIYFYIIKKNITNIRWILTALFLLLIALVFSTERVYPTIFLILIVEAFNLLKFKTKDILRNAIIRITLLLSPVIVAAAIKPVFIGLLVPNSTRLIQGLSEGRWDYLLVPFIALASMIFPQKYWGFLSITHTDSLLDFIRILVSGPLPLLIIIVFLIGKLLTKNAKRFIAISLLVFFFGAITVFLLALGHSGTNPGPALLGFYILGLAAGFFVEWLVFRKGVYIGLFAGPFIAFLFIVNTWFATMDRELVFGGVHRYLTMPSIFTSIFLGNLLILLHLQIYRKKLLLKITSFIPILLLIPIFYFSVSETEDFFNYALKIGFANYDKIYMRGQFWPYLRNLSIDNPRLIYINHYTDQGNTFYYGNTIISGFDVWTLWLPHINFKRELVPQFIADFDKLKSSVVVRDGVKGVFYNQKFYKADNFYAVLLKDRKVFDITDQMKKEIALY